MTQFATLSNSLFCVKCLAGAGLGPQDRRRAIIATGQPGRVAVFDVRVQVVGVVHVGLHRSDARHDGPAVPGVNVGDPQVLPPERADALDAPNISSSSSSVMFFCTGNLYSIDQSPSF